MNYDENIWKLWNHIQTPTQLLFLPHEKFCSSPRWDSVHFVVHLAFSMADNGTELNFLGTMEPHFSHIFSYFPQYPMATTLRLAMDRTQAFRPSRFGSCGRFDPGLGSSSDGRFVRDLVITLFTTNGYHIWDMTWLVVWNMTFMTFHFIYFHIWDVILPIDEVICFKMVKTTNQQQMITLWWLNSSRAGKSPRLRTVNPCKSSFSMAIFLC